jgi:hypothetical protein
VAGAGLILVLVADDILGGLDITDETWRLAAGVVCVLVGSRTVVAPALSELPRSERPQLAVLAVLFGATESFVLAWALLAVGVAAGTAVGALRYRRPDLWTALARSLAAVLVIIGVALVVAGIRDV